MHNVMYFIGCIGNLMKGSGVEEPVGAAYSGLAGILSGKSWPRAMRAFRMECAVVMSDYLGGDGSRTFNDLTEYLERRHGRRQLDGFGWTVSSSQRISRTCSSGGHFLKLTYDMR